MPAALVGAAIMITIIIDSIADPLIGRYSDTLRTRFGRRHAVMYASILPAALGVFAMWRAPENFGAIALLVFMIGTLSFVRLAVSGFEIPLRALGPELAPDYHDRTALVAWRFVFSIAGGAALNAILYQVFLREDAANPLGILNRDRYTDFGVFAAIVMLVAMVVSTAATSSRIRYLHVPPVQKSSMREAIAEFRAGFANPQLVSLLFATMLNGFGGGLWFGLVSYIALNFWEFKPQEFAFVLISAPFASVVSLWIAPIISSRIGKRPFMMACYLLWLVMFATPYIARYFGLLPPNRDPNLLIVIVAFQFVELIFAFGVHTVLNSMLADAADDVAVRTGRRSEGVLFAGYGLLDKWGIAFGSLLAGLVLAWVAFPTRAMPGTVDPSISNALVLWAVPLTAACNMVAMVLISRFQLDKTQHESNLAVLRAREGSRHGGA